MAKHNGQLIQLDCGKHCVLYMTGSFAGFVGWKSCRLRKRGTEASLCSILYVCKDPIIPTAVDSGVP